MALLKYLLPLFFLIFSFSELLRINLGNGVSFNLIDAFTLILIIYWIIKIKKTGNYELKKPVMLFVLICVLSLLFSLFKFEYSQVLIGSLYLIRFVLYGTLYFVFKDLNHIKNISIQKYLFIPGFLIIVLGYLQLLFFPSLKNFYHLGWDEHLYRMFSTFLDPNFLGTFIVLFLIFLLVIKENYKSNKNQYLFLNFSLVVGLIALILTFSRGAILMLLVSVLTYCILKKTYKLLIGIFLVLIFAVIILSPRFYLVNNDLFRLPSFNQRIENAGQAIKIYQKNPVIGVGFNNFRYAREDYGFKDTSPVGVSHAGAGSDNSFALVLATTGVIGFGFYLYLIYRIYKLGFSRIKNNPFALILVISLTGLIANSMFINSMFYSFVMIWMWVLMGLTENS